MKLFRVILGLGRRGLLNWMPDRAYIQLVFVSRFGKLVDFKNPKTFNEKLQWLKLYDRKDDYTVLVDKYEVKKYIEKTIGKEYVIPTIGVYDCFDDIDFTKLPEKFVIKCTHDSGSVVVVNDKNSFDMQKAKEKIDKGMKNNGYLYGREWPYKNVKRRVIVEKYLTDEEDGTLKDYKFFVFGGEVKCFKVDFDRLIGHRANYFDRDGNLLRFGEEVCPPDYNKKIVLPNNLKKMISLAEKLSNNIPFVRIDFYNVQNDIYFGEITFYPASGFGSFMPESWDEKLGGFIPLEAEEQGKKKKVGERK